ncbi:MAG: AraC family transcriptional regulator [Clostridia bacterium]|nr:AraC family transcriptional regulator [Clostridia bacterium]
MIANTSSCIVCYEKNYVKGEISEAEHSHEHIEFIYVYEGGICAVINGNEIKASAGELVVINSGASHALNASKKKCRYTVIDFLPGLVTDSAFLISEIKFIMPFISPAANGRVFPADAVKKSIVPRLADEALKEYTVCAPGYLIALHAVVGGIFSFVLRHMNNDGFSFSTVPDKELLKVMEKAVSYIKENLADVNEREIAEMCGLSYSYFSRSFKRIIHMSFSEYCNMTRISESERLLLETDKPVSVIANELGFSSASHFIQTFRKFRNCSPKKYRIMIQGKINNEL